MYAQPLPVSDPDYPTGEYSGATAYARSKRTQVELLGILAERWADLRVYAMHPGWAADRRQRHTMILGRNAPTEEQRQRMWQWVAEAAGIG